MEAAYHIPAPRTAMTLLQVDSFTVATTFSMLS
jgi:hypothetical protein